MIKFVDSSSDGLPLKRKQTQRACDACRKRKVGASKSCATSGLTDKPFRNAATMTLKDQVGHCLQKITRR